MLSSREYGELKPFGLGLLKRRHFAQPFSRSFFMAAGQPRTPSCSFRPQVLNSDCATYCVASVRYRRAMIALISYA